MKRSFQISARLSSWRKSRYARRIGMLLIVCTVIVIVLALNHLLSVPQPRVPLTVTLVGLTNDSTGLSTAELALTNLAPRSVWYVVGSMQVLSNNAWTSPDFLGFGHSMPFIGPRESASVMVLMPQQSGPWKVPVLWAVTPSAREWYLYGIRRELESLRHGVWLRKPFIGMAGPLYTNSYLISISPRSRL